MPRIDFDVSDYLDLPPALPADLRSTKDAAVKALELALSFPGLPDAIAALNAAMIDVKAWAQAVYDETHDMNIDLPDYAGSILATPSLDLDLVQAALADLKAMDVSERAGPDEHEIREAMQACEAARERARLERLDDERHTPDGEDE